LLNISATVRPYRSMVWGRSVTTEPTEPLLAVGGHFSRCGKLREILPTCDGFRAI
jgi:hypothetical protein